MGVQELLDLHWICCTEHHNLALLIHDAKDVLDVHLEVHGEQLVYLIQNEEVAAFQVGYFLAG